MRRQRRISELQLSFDGLTDSVTNLVGALILLVVLSIGLTQEVVEQTVPAAPTAPSQPLDPQYLEETKTVEELLRKVDQLQAQIVAADQQVHDADQRVEQLRVKAAALLKNTPAHKD